MMQVILVLLLPTRNPKAERDKNNPDKVILTSKFITPGSCNTFRTVSAWCTVTFVLLIYCVMDCECGLILLNAEITLYQDLEGVKNKYVYGSCCLQCSSTSYLPCCCVEIPDKHIGRGCFPPVSGGTGRSRRQQMVRSTVRKQQRMPVLRSLCSVYSPSLRSGIAPI